LGVHGEGFNFITYELIVWKEIVNDAIEGPNYARSHQNYFGHIPKTPKTHYKCN
jgi:hypothetical protein